MCLQSKAGWVSVRGATQLCRGLSPTSVLSCVPCVSVARSCVWCVPLRHLRNRFPRQANCEVLLFAGTGSLHYLAVTFFLFHLCHRPARDVKFSDVRLAVELRSAQWMGYGLVYRGIGVCFLTGSEISVFFTAFRTAVGPIQPM